MVDLCATIWTRKEEKRGEKRRNDEDEAVKFGRLIQDFIDSEDERKKRGRRSFN